MVFELKAFVSLFNENDDKRKAVVQMARAAEAAERYEDMCEFMKYLVEEIAIKEPQSPLTVEERNLLSVAYKNVIGTRRASWRTLTADVEHSEKKDAELVSAYIKVVEGELTKTCQAVTALIDDLIAIDSSKADVEANVFYLKMAGDYYRYLAESVSDHPEHKEKAKTYYGKAYALATTGDNCLVPTHPIRLGLALNYSVCHYEILKDKTKACELAKKAFDDAIAKLDKLEENDYKDSTLIMQLLRDNLTLWSAAGEDADVAVEDLSDDEN